GAADRGDRVAARVPVREVARDRDLERAEHRDVEMAAAHHRERVGVVEERPAGEERHRLLPSVDEVSVLLALRARGPHAEDAVLAVEKNFAVLRQVVADERRHADAEVDVRALGNVLRDALRDLLAGEFGVAHAAVRPDIPRVTLPPAGGRYAPVLRGTFTTRVTKMPGVTITSGSSFPSSTVSYTCAIVTFAALAIVGP